MKIGQSSKKVSGGKLIRLDVTYSAKVERVKITGDFFLHPEDFISTIEESLSGTDIPIDSSMLIRKVEQLIQENEAMLIGVSAEDIVSVLEEAVK